MATQPLQKADLVAPIETLASRTAVTSMNFYLYPVVDFFWLPLPMGRSGTKQKWILGPWGNERDSRNVLGECSELIKRLLSRLNPTLTAGIPNTLF